jgi:hypothetical protein
VQDEINLLSIEQRHEAKKVNGIKIIIWPELFVITEFDCSSIDAIVMKG